MEAPNAQMEFTDKAVADVWMNYAKQRFDEVNSRIDSLRSTARQMIVWIGAAIGLELGYLPKLFDLETKANIFLMPLCVPLAIVATVFQIYAIWKFTELGYLYSSLVGPAAPTEALRHSLEKMSEIEAKSMVGQSYSNAYQAYQLAATEIATKSKDATRLFAYPVILFLTVMLVHTTVNTLLK